MSSNHLPGQFLCFKCLGKFSSYCSAVTFWFGMSAGKQPTGILDFYSSFAMLCLEVCLGKFRNVKTFFLRKVSTLL